MAVETGKELCVGDRVKITSNDLQPNMVGKVAQIKKVYASFSLEDGFGKVYRIMVDGNVLRGVASDNDITKI
jgi:hypothetical protein